MGCGRVEYIGRDWYQENRKCVTGVEGVGKVERRGLPRFVDRVGSNRGSEKYRLGDGVIERGARKVSREGVTRRRPALSLVDFY